MRRASIVQPNAKEWLDKFRFSTRLRVRYCETDLLGHVNNVSYFMYFEQGRIEYVEKLGINEYIFDGDKVSVVADLQCQYLSPIYLRDSIDLYVRTAELGRSSMDIEYALVVDGSLKAAGRGAIVVVDAATGKSVRIPEPARERVAAFEGLPNS